MPESKLPELAELAKRGLIFLLSLLALGFVGLFYAIALKRVTFPYMLEWSEGGVLDMMRRIVHHQQLYVAPSKDFVPFMYTPIYYYLGAVLSHFTGVGLVPLRVLSIVATTGCFVVIFHLVRRDTGDRFSAWMACGVFAALYAQTNAWFDLARVDMLYLFFLLLAIGLAERGLPVWAAIVFAVAFQTKQTALAVAVLVLAHEIGRPRKLIAGLGTFGLAVGLSSWLIDRQNHGWYRYYTAFLPSRQAWLREKFALFWLRDLIDPLGVLLLVTALGTALYFSKSSRGTEDRRRMYFFLFTTVGLTVSSLSSRLHLGGSNNVTLPLYAWLCVLFGLSLHKILSSAKQAPANLSVPLQLAALVACLLQFSHLIYSPGSFVPTAAQRADATDALNRVSALPGKIFVMHHVIDAGSAGKEGFAGSMAIWDVLRADHGEAGQRLKAELIASFQNKEYDGILCDRSPSTMFPEEQDYLGEVTAAAGAAYPMQSRILSVPEEAAFYANPSTPQIKPQFLYVPRAGVLQPKE
ncbi:glycosyltransferase family 87 protein [Granulicella sp. S190]|uniref:glycosyltransferase family 87 protein n=1 Tax=Granulicella sp. S190 TaxID=1747226 RepID=UPI00131ECAAA|nr:glycosyltransferase family 87 protein [Granulicella sp. S190]